MGTKTTTTKDGPESTEGEEKERERRQRNVTLFPSTGRFLLLLLCVNAPPVRKQESGFASLFLLSSRSAVLGFEEKGERETELVFVFFSSYYTVEQFKGREADRGRER